jgi:hypothetical protein
MKIRVSMKLKSICREQTAVDAGMPVAVRLLKPASGSMI